MKKLIIALCLLTFSCTPLLKYTPPVIEPPKKMEHYALPVDPTASLSPPKAIFLKQDTDGKYIECPETEAYLTAYTGKEHDKIVLRLTYYKELIPQMVNYVNVIIDIGNVRLDLQVDQRLVTEVYKQMWIDAVNNTTVQQRWDTLAKTGQWALIIAEMAAIILLIVK
jgi:hypothetical protein